MCQDRIGSTYVMSGNGGIFTTPSFPSRIGASIMGWAGDAGCTPRPPIRPRPASERRVIIVIFLGLLLDLLAFTLLLPLLPGLLESHGREKVSPSPKAESTPCLAYHRFIQLKLLSLLPRTLSMDPGSVG